MHAHAGSARRGDSRRRMRVALAINVALLAAEVVGGVLTGSLAVLADAGHLLSDVGAIVLALAASHLASRPAGAVAPLATSALRCLRRSSTAWCSSRSGSASRWWLSAVSLTRPRSTAPACSRWVRSVLPGTWPRPWCSPRGQRQDLNLEGVLRHSQADALGSLGVILAGGVVLAGGSPIVDPIVGLLISILVLASSWRLIAEPSMS